MNNDLERMKLGLKKLWEKKGLFLIPLLYFLLLIIAGQKIINILSFPLLFLPIAKIVWVCVVFCGLMRLLALLGTPRFAQKYEKALATVVSGNYDAIPAILASVVKTERGIILEFISDRLSVDDYNKHLPSLEVALDLNIIEICRGCGVRHVLIKAIPGNHQQSHIIPWDNSYLSDKDFELVFGQTPFGVESLDIATTPHILEGGASGSGKSQLLKLMIYECVLKGATVHIVDMKGGLDFTKFFQEKCNLITNEEQFFALLEETLSVMDERKKILVSSGSTNLAEHNKIKGNTCPLPRIIIACDEIAEILDKTGLDKGQKERISKIESALSTIARLGRAFGIHLILSTQRPSADLIPGQIRSNTGYRVCGRADKILSQMILDDNSAAEKISPDSQGLFCTNMGTLFKAFYLDESQLE